MLKIDNIKFSYGTTKIIKGLSLNINKGAFIGIIGPNGSGKTTLLKNISKNLETDSGSILLEKKLLAQYSAAELAKKMAVVPQNTEINFNFSVYDIIIMGRHPYQKRWSRLSQEDKLIVKKVMEVTDTLKLKEKTINQLSGGEKQRVIIARALAQKPEILLLDEPTASLDINYQGEIYDLLSYLNQELELTIITVSHDLNLTAQYCEELILINKGQIQAAGLAEEVLTEENIKNVYNTEVIIKKNPLSEKPFITLIPKSKSVYQKKKIKKNIKIHVIAGGGTAKKYLQQLSNLGYNLSAGVLNRGDSDWELAKKLGIEVVEAPPFVNISKSELNKNKELIKKADLIILSDIPFGHGNIDNLRVLLDFPNKSKILFNNYQIKKRDYTKGKAELIWNKLLEEKKNIILLNKKENLLKKIHRLAKSEMGL